MNAWIVPVLVLLSTTLVVSVTYITQTLRHKQRMFLLEKNLDPDYFKNDNQRSWMRIGFLLIGAGTGFLAAFLIDLLVFDGRNGTDPLYPSLTAICAGIALLLSKRLQ